jgi:zinc transport system permease protein
VGLLAPAVGFFLVQRGMSLIGDGIGHVAFTGVAAGYLLEVSPTAVALGAAVAGAVLIELLRARRQAAGDQALALVFYTGIAAGVVLVSAAGRLDVDLFAFLFGSVLTVTWSDFWTILALGIGGLVVLALLYRALAGVVLDEEGARVAGVPVTVLNVVVSALAGITIAVSMQVVGVLLVAALMALPVIAASRIAWSLASTLALAMGIGLAAALGGLTLAYYGDLAPGGAIVLLAAGAFAAAAGYRALRPA